MVDFPIKGLDVSEYVLNHNLPEKYLMGESEQTTKK